MRSGATCSAGQQKNVLASAGRSWMGVLDMGVALGRGREIRHSERCQKDARIVSCSIHLQRITRRVDTKDLSNQLVIEFG